MQKIVLEKRSVYVFIENKTVLKVSILFKKTILQ